MGKGLTADALALLGLVLLLLLPLFLFLILFLLLLAVFLLLLFPGGLGLCRLQGFFQALGGFVGFTATCTSFSTAGLTRPSSSAVL